MWVIARTPAAIGGLVWAYCVIMISSVPMIVRVTGMGLVSRLAVMAGHLAILVDMGRRGRSRQSRPGGEEHHRQESHDLPDKSYPHVPLSFVPAKSVKRLHEWQALLQVNKVAP
jgi:hypothetical protein